MGCDIHEYVEVRDANGKWRCLSRFEPCSDDPEARRMEEFGAPISISRHYRLFAILAGVRNGRGFAGCDTGDAVTPIAEPRGLPADCDPNVRRQSDAWDVDGHSHSWLSLAEILAFDWTQRVEERSDVSAMEFVEWGRWARSRGEGPRSGSGNVFGHSIEHVSVKEMDRRLAEINERAKAACPDGNWGRVFEEMVKREMPSVYTRIGWTLPYHKCVPEFWSDVIPVLLRLGKPEDVRLVFWFDN